MQLAFLAPDIQQAILAGHQPPGLTPAELMAEGFPLAWDAQRDRFGFASHDAGNTTCKAPDWTLIRS